MTSLPTRNAMPDSSGVQANVVLLRFGRLMSNDDGRAYEARAMLTVAARAADRSIVAYRRASAAIDEWLRSESDQRATITPTDGPSPTPTVATMNLGAIHRAGSELEECITNLRRLSRFGMELQKLAIVDAMLMPPAADVDAVREMRDAIDHTDDRILAKRQPAILAGMMPLLMPSDVGAELGAHVLPYDVIYRTMHAWRHGLATTFGGPGA